MKQREREMHSIWVSFKEKFNCGSKLTDVIRCQENNIQYVKCTRKENSERKLIHGVMNPMDRENGIDKHYVELRVGEPSRNVIEMIFRAASTNPMKQSRRINTVLKVKNSFETLRRFEMYREMVMKKAYEQYKMHPRSMVDGNELLRFCDTTMTCCQREPSWVSELCEELACGVCRMIRSIFSTEGTKKKEIQLSSSCKGLNEATSANSKGKTVKRAVIVCRVIAGRVGNMVDEENEEKYDSIQSEKWNNTENLIVHNPSAVLPCFVVVFT